MSKSNDMGTTTRRSFLQRSGAVAAGATLLGGAVPAVHAAENNTIRLALIGCGHRGRGAVANYAALMGRAAVHYNNIVTWDQVVTSKFQFCDYLDNLSYDSPAPVQADENGYFPAPVAGKWKEL